MGRAKKAQLLTAILRKSPPDSVPSLKALQLVARTQLVTVTFSVERRSPREKLVLAQTPQVFRRDLLNRAFQSARDDGFTGTDEASLVERLDVEVTVVVGSDRNIKITRPGDMDLARLFYREELAKVAGL